MIIKTILLRTALLLCLCISIFASADDNKWDGLFDHSIYLNAKISPDGKHLAVAVNIKGKRALIFFKTEKLNKPVGALNFGGRFEVGEYHWVNNERVVLNTKQRLFSKEVPVSYGELYAVNIDGSNRQMIYGYQAGEKQIGSLIKKKKSTRGWGEIIDVLPEDDKHILISSTPMSKTGERLATVYRLNVYTGILKNKLGTSPIPFARFITDTKGELRALVGTDSENNNQIYVRQGNDWKKLPKDTVTSSVNPVGISASGNYLYTLDHYKQDIGGLFKLNLKDFSYKHVFTDEGVDITDLEMTTDGRSPYAIRTDAGYPSYLILNKKAEESAVFKSLLSTFPGDKITITSKTDKGDFYVFEVSSDIQPGSLYLFDKKNNSIKALFKFKPKFNESDFSPIEPIQFTASDGQVINGYFTPVKSAVQGKTSKSENKKPAPVVVLVHGGPHGSRDYWEYSPEIQYLSLHGFSVLQVNFRGSGGYGSKFEIDGYRKWGTRIQQDILDGYLWLINQGKAEAGNACIMGTSFGAYSAVQSAAIYPDTYQCTVANAGIYDLELMFEEGDIQSRRSGKSYLKNVLGTNEKILKNMSPVNYVDKISIPLLLAHGEDDERAPFEHAESLRSALDDADKSYEWFAIDKEEHGFYNPETQKSYMRKVVKFLDKNLDK
jgi:dipeptidyl aminopeptidase/acylaminoacyl peptidase